MINKQKYWVVIPAAGVGKRMLVNHPKQYLPLGSSTVIEQTISQFSSNRLFEGIVVAISKNDEYWTDLTFDCEVPIFETEGGQERCHSVLNSLSYLEGKAQANDWILVHDAARPCIHSDDITKLVHSVNSHAVGGLLGLPVADTLKFCGDNLRVKRTISRNGLWRALTPQMFRYQKLRQALEESIKHPEKITDEASAMEMAGYEPMMIEGRWDNIKITHPQDLSQASVILASQRK